MGMVQPRLEPVTAPGVPAACVTAFGAVPVVPQNLEKPCDLGDRILLPLSPVPVMGMELFCA